MVTSFAVTGSQAENIDILLLLTQHPEGQKCSKAEFAATGNVSFLSPWDPGWVTACQGCGRTLDSITIQISPNSDPMML